MVIPTIVGTDPAELDTLLNAIGDAANTDIGALQDGAGRGTLANFSVSNLAALDALVTTMVNGDTAMVSTASTGISRIVWVRNNDAPSVEPLGHIVAATKANMDSYISTVAGLASVKFAIGGTWSDTATKLRYRFTSTAGAYLPISNQTITPSAATGTGVTISSDGVVQWTNGTAASPLVIDGWFPTAFRVFRLRITGGVSAGISVSNTIRLRTLTPADNSSNTYSATELLGRNGNATAGGPSTATSWSLPIIGNSYAAEATIYNVNIASPTGMLVSVGSVELPQALSNANLVTQKLHTHNTSTAMGGMSITVNTNFTGTLLLAVEGIY